MRRRDFVRRLPVVTGGLAVAGASLPLAACAGVPYLRPVPSGPGTLMVESAGLPPSGAFVQATGMERPLFLHRGEDGRVTAVLASCTHNGCLPEPVGARLACPCHGSEFAFDGALLSGPAERALARYEVAEEAGRLIVRLDRTVSR